MSLIGKRIAEARKARRMTQEELATALGVYQSTISQLESGVHAVPNDMSSYARVLKVPVEWLHYGVVGEPVNFVGANAHGYKRRFK